MEILKFSCILQQTYDPYNNNQKEKLNSKNLFF